MGRSKMTVGKTSYTTDLALPGKKLAIKGILVQLSFGLLAVLMTSVYDLNAALSVTLGVIAFLLPHSIFAYWVFRYAGATKNSVVAQSMNQGMKLKLILTFFIFVIAFSQFNTQPLFIFGAYAVTMCSQATAMFIFGSKL